MIADINSFVTNLRKNLSSNLLPGIEAQLKMSPNVRNPHFESQIPNELTKKAAVLITILIQKKAIKTVLIKRTEYDGAHSGQISFPGGKVEKTDKNIYHTALREANEEIGININKIEIIGSLTTLYVPISDICICPVIGLAMEKINYKLNHNEVVEAIEVNIESLLNSKNISQMQFFTNNLEIIAPYYKVKNNNVWGATAMIISEFLEVIKRTITFP
ncbi:MAG: hypothetical protein A2046_02300 [Bacteroidetes bacterium GWA2_30_7]|nr:MAG: hypothetical protein A2046_02300 [Bacteroidetes bacterium GWA2_30_7]